MRHHAQHIAFGIANAGDIVEGAVRADFRRDLSLRCAIPKDHLSIGLQSSQRHGVGIVIPFGMGDRNFEYLAGLACTIEA